MEVAYALEDLPVSGNRTKRPMRGEQIPGGRVGLGRRPTIGWQIPPLNGCSLVDKLLGVMLIASTAPVAGSGGWELRKQTITLKRDLMLPGSV